MSPFLKNPKIILVITLAIVIPFISYYLIFDQQSNQILSEKTEITPSLNTNDSLPAPNSPLPNNSPTPTPPPNLPKAPTPSP